MGLPRLNLLAHCRKTYGAAICSVPRGARNRSPPETGLLALGAELFEDADGPVVGALDGVGRRLAAEHLAEHVGPEVGGLQGLDPRHWRRREVAAAGVARLVVQDGLPGVRHVRASVAGLDLRLV